MVLNPVWSERLYTAAVPAMMVHCCPQEGHQVHLPHGLLLPGELPVLLAVEASAGRLKTVLAEQSVLDTLRQHRLAELKSTGGQERQQVTQYLWRQDGEAC